MTRLRYNVRETLHYGRPAVTYEVKTGRNGCKKAFELTVEATARSIHDTWPLRREIARHAGVDPDLVMPDWDGDAARRSLGRFAPHLWYVQLPEPAPAQCLSCGHAPHPSGTECEAIVDHGPRRWHRCLCLAAPGASKACPPQMNCQGGPLSFADIWSLRQGRSVRGQDGETITPDVLAEPPPIVIARAVRTCTAVPSQWNAWTVDGQYLYLRYRSGIGTVDAYDDENSEQWTRIPNGAVARFDTGDRSDGEMDLIEFCARTGLRLAGDAEVIGE